MAFASYNSKSGFSVGSRTVLRLDRPLTVSSMKPVAPSPLPFASAATRTKSASSLQRRSSVGSLKTGKDDSGVPGRVRVAVRLRPRNAEEQIADADFADCVELLPELKRLKLRKNNWDCETYQFDEVLTETASQKRVYEVVAKPVVESVLEGYNGTVMAYGQTGTGKTFTLGRIGEEDCADRGIMVRAMEDILADISPEHDTVTVSYLQLYMESVQDLLAPERDNIPIVEDPKTGDVSLPGATLVELKDQQNFVQLLQTGENNRIASNTKMNTESSRSHALLLVHVKRSAKSKQEKDLVIPQENGNGVQLSKGHRAPTIRKSKLLIVDLAGSERVDKSGSEGHQLEEAKAINLSLTALGKCINALAESSPHVPTRDSKLTRLLRDSFGGTARTSLIITIGPSPRHRAETASTILFGQRAMKVENMLKLKEEFDYKSLCRRLEADLDRLIAENERQSQAVLESEEEMERRLEEARIIVVEAESRLSAALETLAEERRKHQQENKETLQKVEVERAEMERFEQKLKKNVQDLQDQKEKQTFAEKEKHQKALVELEEKYNQELSNVKQILETERAHREKLENELKELLKKAEETTKEESLRTERAKEDELQKLKQQLEKEHLLREQAECELKKIEQQHKKTNGIIQDNEDSSILRQKVEQELQEKEKLEEEVRALKQQLLQLHIEAEESKRTLEKASSTRSSVCSDSHISINRPSNMRDTINGQRATIAKLFEQVGLHKILSLLQSEDVDVRVHAVKVVANLAAEEGNQEKIVEAGGLGSLLMLLQSSEDETIRRVAAGAIANLAMNETNQELIMAQGGIGLLARTADDAEDPQTLRMVAGAIANLCGNEKLQIKLREEGGIRALLGMVRSRHPDVLAQVARGIANFAKCESRGSGQGNRIGRSLLIDDGALPWIVANANNEASPIRRHIELALCHLAQHEVNAKDLVAGGALWELIRISRECSREDIRTLAQRTLNASPTFQAELKRLHVVY
ncbi:hypothetical protein O6H91_01G098500 [Diphasiastrum complanatum]|uniref:Uncharacterized protein n=4 Tax=Diphasiastrum complanatum TaxID=34168 RepID=A0ACC2ETN3_DIPCM|nr:hypothetical protein O6H91_01G098500 [Diphasiastrum complanatum]KAJ7569874.1 hypothetical protein O6H91_01G098500 [Diphasiastrum complanatum]KAJ7569876.1 hypothetical protein O6H91_01G098500 [Diphasiastrum complanatum]KAJ7569877.1 hypothetical protein O6H91_01G098500 [Diphasiastrum complanatum]